MGVYQFSSNLPAPINVSLTEQTKTGNLIIEGVLRLGQFATAPSGTEGALYFDTSESKVKIYSSAAWSELGGGWDGVIPNYTTAQRNALSLVDGLIVYNTTDNAVQIYKSGAWANVGAKLSLAATCNLDGDCDSTHCTDGYCCDTTCGGNCERCNVTGSIGICTSVTSDCTGKIASFVAQATVQQLLITVLATVLSVLVLAQNSIVLQMQIFALLAMPAPVVIQAIIAV